MHLIGMQINKNKFFHLSNFTRRKKIFSEVEEMGNHAHMCWNSRWHHRAPYVKGHAMKLRIGNGSGSGGLNLWSCGG